MGVAKTKKRTIQTFRSVERKSQALQTSLAAIFRQASDPVRLDIILALADGERNVAELVVALEQTRPAISHHLALLRHGSIVSVRREGKHNFYSLEELGRDIVDAAQRLGRYNRAKEPTTTKTVSVDRTLLEDVGGFVDDPECWFNTPNPAFEGRPPIDLLGTADEPRLRNRIEAAKLGMFS
jgi:DNA-binding transcriptional ArsR family regulator